MSVLEATIEQKVCDHAVKTGWLVVKLNIQGRRGWPDRMYIKQGKVLFIEFKRLGEKPRKLQEYIHARLRREGMYVVMADTEQQGRDALDHLASCN